MNNPTFLSLSGPDAIVGMVNEALGPESTSALLLAQWTRPIFHPEVPSVTFVSQPFSTSSLVGQYVGQTTFPYLKRDLSTIFPIPLVYRDPYPTTFIKLQTYFAAQYNVALDDGEFTIAGGDGTALALTSLIDVTPDPVSGLVTLEVLPASLRFVQGTLLKFLPIHPDVPVPLSRLFTLDGDLWVGNLVDSFANPPV